MSIYHDFPIPAGSSKEQCMVFGCHNRAEVLVVIDMPHRSLFERRVWGRPEETHSVAPATATVSFCPTCAAVMGRGEGREVQAGGR